MENKKCSVSHQRQSCITESTSNGVLSSFISIRGTPFSLFVKIYFQHRELLAYIEYFLCIYLLYYSSC